MPGTPCMPELGKHVSTLLMTGVRDPLPPCNLLLRIHAGGREPSTASDRDRSRFRNDEPTVGGPLRIVLKHQIARNIPRLNGPRTSERTHHHAVLQFHGSDLKWYEQRICGQRFHSLGSWSPSTFFDIVFFLPL